MQPSTNLEGKNNLKSYFNYLSSPDLSLIENCWQTPKQAFQRIPHQDNKTMQVIIDNGLNNMSIEFINKQINTMPDRIQAVLDSGKAMTGY